MEDGFLQGITLKSDDYLPYLELLIVIGIGALLGLEREFSKNVKSDESIFAGIRTFPIVGIFAYLSALLAKQLGSNWIIIIALLGTIGLTGLSYLVRSRHGNRGGTSEFSLLVTFSLACLVFYGEYLYATSIAVVVTFILAFKVRLHKAVKKFTREEIFSILFFVIISALMLPVLPNQDSGWYGVFNPYKIWLIVVIFISLNFLAYFISKFIKDDKSLLAIGILGGFASSTATTWYFAKHSRKKEEGGVIEAAAVILASSIMFPRMLVWLFVVNRDLFLSALLPLLVLALIGIGIGIRLSRMGKQESREDQKTLTNPINLREALIFAGLYIGIELLVGYANDHLGNQGLYIASSIAGITNVDAISISLANYSQNQVNLTVTLVALIIAALTNTLVKYGLCLSLGNDTLRKYSAFGFLSIMVLGGGFILYYLLF